MRIDVMSKLETKDRYINIQKSGICQIGSVIYYAARVSGRVVPGLPEEAAPRPTAQARLAEHSFLLLYLSRHT